MQDSTRTAVVGYIRVSTEQQAGEGVSLDAQRARLEAYAVAMDLDLVAVCEDRGLSAKSLARPGLQQALAMLESGNASGLVVTKLDRLTRSVKDLGDLVDRYFASRFSLLSLSDSIDTRTASGRLVLHVLGAVSQWEREATAERTRDALAQLRADGVRLGAEPLGWRRARIGTTAAAAPAKTSPTSLPPSVASSRSKSKGSASAPSRASSARRTAPPSAARAGIPPPSSASSLATAMTRETADSYWGKDAVAHALVFETPDRITRELTADVEKRSASLPPGAFAAWALAQRWPRFCAIVWIVSGALRERLAGGDIPKTLLGDDHDDDR